MNKSVVAKISTLLCERNIDAVFIAPSEELILTAGSTLYLCERFQGLFIKKDGTSFYICNLLHKDEAKEIFDADTKIYTWFDEDDYTETVINVFKEQGLIESTIAVNSTARAFNLFTIAQKTGVKFVNGKELLEETRIIKDNNQMSNLRRASEITDEIFFGLLDFIKPGIKEKDIYDKMGTILANKAYANVTYEALVASGANSALPHYFGNNRLIEENDVILLDFGCCYNGMHADTSRTIFVGNVTEKQKEIYNIVLEANQKAELAAKEGAFIPDISRVARDVIEKYGYGQYYTHRLGHGIGYSVHEAPEIKMVNERVLEKGMAFTIEPGIYLPNEFGIRIEDVLLINEKGETEVLNKTPKDITII